MNFPAKIGKKNIMIKTDAIVTDFLLLFIKSAMKKTNVKIGFSNGTASILDQ